MVAPMSRGEAPSGACAPSAPERGRRCQRCQRGLGHASGFRFPLGSGQPTLRCGRCAVRYPPLLRKAWATALLVGTVLTAINQGDVLLHGPVTLALVWKIPLTYAVPFAVSTYSALAPGTLALRVTTAGNRTLPAMIDATAPAGLPGDKVANLTPVGGSTQAGSVFTGFIVPRSVAGSQAPQTTAFQSPAIVWAVDKDPPIGF